MELAPIYGVRGAFEPFTDASAGMGATLHEVAERTTDLLGGNGVNSAPVRTELIGVAYPANAWHYHWSRHVGVRNLTALLTEGVRRCPDRAIVLLGLSQGADVIRRTLADLSSEVATRLAAVVLLGDPTRHPDDPWTHGTSDPHPGVAYRYATRVPEDLASCLWSYGLDGDEITANRIGLRGLIHSGTSTHYEHNQDGVQDLAAAFVSQRLREDRS